MSRGVPAKTCWVPDRGSEVPVYQQIVRMVREKVADGQWPVGTRLPSQRILAQAFHVNRSTVTAAIDELTACGIVSGCRGAGTQVVSNTWALMLPPAMDWGMFLSAGPFRENISAVQAINRLEFSPHMVRLGTGELDPRLFPVEMWREVMEKVSREVAELGYLEPLGLLKLRRAISRRMETMGIQAPPSTILITSGALQALQLISVCLLRKGSTVFTEAPTYLQSLQVFQSAGMGLHGTPMDSEGIKFWEMEAALKNDRLQGASILYTIPTNQNPTGITMTGRRREELMGFCAGKRLPIIEDGAYHELFFGGPLPPALKSLDRTGAVIYLGSASKTLAPGLRIGWMIAPEPMVQRLGDVKMQMDYGASSVSQWILAEFFESGCYDKYLKELREIMRERRDRALEVLEENYRDIARWNVPGGGFYIWLTFKAPIALDRLFKRAAEEGILLNPGDMYDFKSSRSLRLSYAYTNPREFESGARKLLQIIRREFLPGR